MAPPPPRLLLGVIPLLLRLGEPTWSCFCMLDLESLSKVSCRADFDFPSFWLRTSLSRRRALFSCTILSNVRDPTKTKYINHRPTSQIVSSPLLVFPLSRLEYMSDSIMTSTPRSGEETSSHLLSFSNLSNLGRGLLDTAEKALGLKVSAVAPEDGKKSKLEEVQEVSGDILVS